MPGNGQPDAVMPAWHEAPLAEALPAVTKNHSTSNFEAAQSTKGNALFAPLDEMFHGNQQQICRMLRIFLQVTREDLARLDAAFACGDWDAVRLMAHTMKSACLQIGETEAGRSLMNLESMASSGRPACADEIHEIKDVLSCVFMRVAMHVEVHGGQANERASEA